jgi:hypothetical protein
MKKKQVQKYESNQRLLLFTNEDKDIEAQVSSGVSAKSNAVGQLFGYSLQFPRALLRLLESENDAKVGIEVCGDVSVFSPNGTTLAEEDKSSLNGNPLTNRSINLWKTFYNWITAVNNDILNATTDRFVLYTNHLVPENSFVKQFHKVTSEKEVNDIVKNVQESMTNITEKHNIYKYVDIVLNKELIIFKKILLNFELVDDYKTDNVYTAIRQKLINSFFGEDNIESLLDSLTGWMQKTIMEKIAQNIPAIISRKELQKYVEPLARQIRKKEFLDYAFSKIPNKQELTQKAKEHPVYVKQLEIIKCEQDDIIEAVSDYFRAENNRQVWIEKGIIGENEMKDFENRLCSFHKNKQKHISVAENRHPELEQGKLLLFACLERQEQIANMVPPDRTIQGTYHVLADEKQLGWHPRWQDILTAMHER